MLRPAGSGPRTLSTMNPCENEKFSLPNTVQPLPKRSPQKLSGFTAPLLTRKDRMVNRRQPEWLKKP
jgi:hypothetical protein